MVTTVAEGKKHKGWGEEIQRRWGSTDIAPRRGKQELGDNYAVKVLRRLKKKAGETKRLRTRKEAT